MISSYLASPLDDANDDENSPPMMPDSPYPPPDIPIPPSTSDDEYTLDEDDDGDGESAPISRLLAECIDIPIATYSQDNSPDRNDTVPAGPTRVPNAQ